VADEIGRFGQTHERGIDLIRTEFVNAIVVEVYDDDAMHLGRGLEQRVRFDVEGNANPFRLAARRNDVARRQPAEDLMFAGWRRDWRRHQRCLALGHGRRLLIWRWRLEIVSAALSL
jgi:hypothetical protein